jgi:HEAT repeat protein
LALAGVAVWRVALRSEPPPPPPKKVVAAPAPPPAPPPPPRFEPAAANARALEVLRAHLTVESLRVRRVAAAALARLADPQALETLSALLVTEQSEIAKQDIAYGLARGGEARGLEILVNGLRSSRRDVKADAARLLATLKDTRAETTLSSLQAVSQFRTSAVQQLARLGNKAAIAQLQKTRADEKASEEERKNAAIALGYAGVPEVAEELRALLPDTRFNVGAAGALAVLRDPAAHDTLINQLSTPSLRVSAALGLRRLAPELDVSAILFRLMPDLDSSKDTERVAAAEAVLLLTGPAALAERD